jgi:ADP-ribosylation factor GTPase-activating protein 1
MFSSFALQGAKIAVSGAETLGKTVTESVIKPTATAIRDPDFNKNMQSYVITLSQKVPIYFNVGKRSRYKRI